MKKMQDQLKEVKEKIKSYGLNRENMRDLKKWILNDLMNEEAEEQINASRYERSNNRKDYRNGYKQRSLLTTDGKVAIVMESFTANNIAELCRRHGVSVSNFYKWRDKFIESGKMEKMKENARRRGKDFCCSKIFPEIESIFKELLNN